MPLPWRKQIMRQASIIRKKSFADFVNMAKFDAYVLEPEFNMLHNTCSLRIIHYALGIPPSDPRSWISHVLSFKYYEWKVELVKQEI